MSATTTPVTAEATAAAGGGASGAPEAGASLTEALRKQIEFYFSRENLTQVRHAAAAACGGSGTRLVL